jgi:hypothetical protein
MSYYVITESADEANLPMCKEIAEYLVEAYPGYPWHVRIDGGMLIIKNMKISDTWSMTRKFSDIAHDAKRRKYEVVMAGGRSSRPRTCAAAATGENGEDARRSHR